MPLDVGALAIPLLEGTAQVLLLLCSTLLVGIAGAYELTARNKYCSILVEQPEQLAGYLTSFFGGLQRGQAGRPPDRRVVAGGHWPGLGPGH